MNSALSAILAVSVASYSKSDESNKTRVVETSSGKIRAKRTANVAPSTPKVETAPSCNGVKSKSEPTNQSTLPLPEKGSIGAHGFIKMLRGAKGREEKILAIQAFCGYDLTGDYGSQEMAALMAAKRELNPIVTSGPTLAEIKSAKRSAMGFVQGIPDFQKRQVLDLIAREKLTIETMADHIKHAREDETPEERKNHAGFAALEKARLNQIQREVRALVGEDHTSAAPYHAKDGVLRQNDEGTLALVGERKPEAPVPNKWGVFFKR